MRRFIAYLGWCVVFLALAQTCHGQGPIRLALDALEAERQQEVLPELVVEPVPEPEPVVRYKVTFTNGIGRWFDGTDEEWQYQSVMREGWQCPYENGEPMALEYHDGYLYPIGTYTAGEATPQVVFATTDNNVVVEYFGADWCGGCRTQKPIIEKLRRAGVTVRIVNIDQSDEYSGRIPHTRIRVDGRITDRWTGYVSESTIRRNLPSRADDEEQSAPVEIDDGTPAESIKVALARLPRPEVAFGDLGCGDGRVLIAAWNKWGCKVIGYEIDAERAEEARRNLEDAGVGDFEIIVQDACELEELPFDVGYAYQFPDVLEKFKPLLLTLRGFATYAHRVPGVTGMVRVVEPNVWYWRQVETQDVSQPPTQTAQTSRYRAWYQENWYYADEWGDHAQKCQCGMCQTLMAQWTEQGWQPN